MAAPCMPDHLFRCADVRCLLTFGAGSDVETDLLTFGQGLETRTLDRRKVGEKIIAAIGWGDEAEALGIVKPLYCTCCHFESPEKQTKGTCPELKAMVKTAK